VSVKKNFPFELNFYRYAFITFITSYENIMFMHIICISCAFKVETPPKFSEGFYKKPCIPKGTASKKYIVFQKILCGWHGNLEKEPFWANLLLRAGSKISWTVRLHRFKFLEKLHLVLRNGVNQRKIKKIGLVLCCGIFKMVDFFKAFSIEST